MNVYERYIAGLSERTGIGIRLYERLPESLDPQIFRIIEKNSATGWYDSVSDSVCLFKRNLPSEESSIDPVLASALKELSPTQQRKLADFLDAMIHQDV